MAYTAMVIVQNVSAMAGFGILITLLSLFKSCSGQCRVTKLELLDYGQKRMRQLPTIILTLLTLTSFGQEKDSVDSTNYIFVEEPIPSYPGGHAEMIKFIKKNLKYPKDSGMVRGKVYVEFVINDTGSLSDIRVVKGLTDSFDNSALETVKNMPKWIPAKRDDKPIKTKMILAITFD